MKRAGSRGAALLLGGGCAAIALGGSVVAASFALLWSRSGPPAHAAPAPEPEEPEPTAGSLAVSAFSFRSAAGAEIPGDFADRAPINYRFVLAGLSPAPDGEWSVKIDLQVSAPAGVKVVEGPVLQDRGTQPGPIVVGGTVDLSTWSPPGSYAMTFKIEDRVAGAELSSKQRFTLR